MASITRRSRSASASSPARWRAGSPTPGMRAAASPHRGHEVRVIAAPPYYPAWRVGAGYSAWRWQREQIDGASVYRCPLYVPARPRGASRVLHLAGFALASLPVAIAQALLFRPDALIAIAPPITAAP